MAVGSGVEVPPASFLRMFLKDKNRLEERWPWRDMEDIIDDNKRAKDPNKVRDKMYRDSLVKIKNIIEKWMKGEMEPRLKQFFVDSDLPSRPRIIRPFGSKNNKRYRLRIQY